VVADVTDGIEIVFEISVWEIYNSELHSSSTILFLNGIFESLNLWEVFQSGGVFLASVFVLVNTIDNFLCDFFFLIHIYWFIKYLIFLRNLILLFFLTLTT